MAILRVRPTMFLALVLVSTLISGCAAIQSTVAAYDGPRLPEEKLATVLASMSYKHGSYSTLPMQVDDKVVGDDYMRGFPSAVQLLPGKHVVVVKCQASSFKAYPFVNYEFKAGHFYELACRDVGKGGYAAASIVEHGARDPRPNR